MAQLKNTTISDTGSIALPVGTTAQRPASPAGGQIRYNTNINDTEYYDGAAWRPISDSNPEATGGTVVDTDIGGVPYRIHLFTNTGNSTFAVARGGEVEYLIIGGGGGGGRHSGGGGGAGGLLTGVTTATPQAYTITVGAGGASLYGTYPSLDGGVGINGGNSVAFGLTALGGGGGGFYGPGGNSGGSGGGAGRDNAGGAGTAGQGNAGGSGTAGGFQAPNYPAHGGGGAGSAGQIATQAKGGDGGQGIVSAITGTNNFYAGGGGGNIQYTAAPGGVGGLGGGGAGSTGFDGLPPLYGIDGVPNTGGGGGGTHYDAPATGTPGVEGRGGSGIVVIRYRRNATTATSPNETRVSYQPYLYFRDVRTIIARDGLVLDLDAANPMSYAGTGTAWTDLSGNGNTGTLVNGVGYSASNGGSLVFDGTGDHIDCGTGGSLTLGNNGPFTASAWIKITTLKNYSGIISKVRNDRGGVYSFMCTAHNDGRLAFYNNAAWYFSTNAGITTNTLYNIVFSFNGSAMSYYVNGVAYGTSTLTWPETTAHKVFIGSWYSINTLYDLAGNISNAQLYNRALSAAEIQQNFNALRGRYGY